MKFKFSYFLITCLAIGSAALWVNVFALFHSSISSYIFGFPVGIGIVGTLARSANILPRVQSKRSRKVGWALLGILVAIEPIVLGFANYPVIIGAEIGFVAAYVISGGASVVVTLTLALGAVVDRSLVPAEKQIKSKPKAKGFACGVAGCSYVAKSQKALNGHKRKHSKVVGYVAHFEPVK